MNCFINRNCSFYIGYGQNNQEIVIGDNVSIGMNVTFCCVSHKIADSECRAGEHEYNSIIVKKGAWIGANVTILPGVIIGQGSVVAAGTLVKKDVPDNVVVAGVPAKIIKHLDKE